MGLYTINNMRRSTKHKVYQFYIMNPGFWRFSLRPHEQFNPLGCCDFEALNDYVREKLKTNNDLCKWLDIYISRPNGYHLKLIRSKNNSSTRRSIYYTTKLLLSSTIRNDTGVRGGISGVAHKIENNNISNAIKLSEFSKGIKFIKFDRYMDPIIILIKKSNKNDLIVPVDTSQRIKTEDINWDTIYYYIEVLFSFFLNSANIIDTNSNTVVFFAVDFFRIGKKLIPFECHFPGRGLGIHFNSILHLNKHLSSTVINTISSLKDILISKFGSNYKFCFNEFKKTNFHSLDLDFANLLCNSLHDYYNQKKTKKISVNCLLDYNKNVDIGSFPSRHLPNNVPSIDSIILRDSGDLNKDNIHRIIDKLGKWVVIKQYVNFPWWHERRRRPEFELINSTYGYNSIKRFLMNGPIQIQPIVTSSTDVYGHFGELRVYSFAIFSKQNKEN